MAKITRSPACLGTAPGHSPLTHTECQPPAATSAIRRPCRASNSLGSSSASSVPWPNCPCLIKGVLNQQPVHGKRSSPPRASPNHIQLVLTCLHPRRTPDRLRTASAHARHPAPAGAPAALGPEAGRRGAAGSRRHGHGAAAVGYLP